MNPTATAAKRLVEQLYPGKTLDQLPPDVQAAVIDAASRAPGRVEEKPRGFTYMPDALVDRPRVFQPALPELYDSEPYGIVTGDDDETGRCARLRSR